MGKHKVLFCHSPLEEVPEYVQFAKDFELIVSTVWEMLGEV
jgi:hypothetical protein